MLGEFDGVVRILTNRKNLFDFLFYVDTYVGWPVRWKHFLYFYDRKGMLTRGDCDLSFCSDGTGKLFSYLDEKGIGEVCLACEQHGCERSAFPYDKFVFRFGRNDKVKVVGKKGVLEEDGYYGYRLLVGTDLAEEDFSGKYFRWKPFFRNGSEGKILDIGRFNSSMFRMIDAVATFRGRNVFGSGYDGYNYEGIVKARWKADEYLSTSCRYMNRMSPRYLMRRIFLVCYFLSVNRDMIKYGIGYVNSYHYSKYLDCWKWDKSDWSFLKKAVRMLREEEIVPYGFRKEGYGFLLHDDTKRKLEDENKYIEELSHNDVKWAFL